MFLAYLAIQYIIVPHLFMDFIKNALSVVGESGGVVPSSYKLVTDLLQGIAKVSGTGLPAGVPAAAAVVLAAAILYLAYRGWRQLQPRPALERKVLSVMLICLTYALVHPRFKDYMYLLLLLPAYYLIKNIRTVRAAPLLFILFVLSGQRMLLPLASELMGFIWYYYPLMVAFCTWGLYLYEIACWQQPIPSTKSKQRR